MEATANSIVVDEGGVLLGRLKGGKGQIWEGGIRMPGAVRWPGVVPASSVSDTLVSNTVLKAIKLF